MPKQTSKDKQPTSSAQNFWTGEKINLLLKLDDEGKTSTEIVAIIGGTRNMVLGKLHRLKNKVKGKHGRTSKPIPVSPYVGYVGLLELLPHQCRWPIEKGFCGCERLAGAAWPYCEKHLITARRKC